VAARARERARKRALGMPRFSGMAGFP